VDSDWSDEVEQANGRQVVRLNDHIRRVDHRAKVPDASSGDTLERRNGLRVSTVLQRRIAAGLDLEDVSAKAIRPAEHEDQ
jgi:hypothetical protein